MADASIRSQAPRARAVPRRPILPTWADLATLVRGREAAFEKTPPRSGGCSETGAILSGPDPEGPAHPASPFAAFPLLNAYAASAVEMERRTKELESGVALNHGPIALQALIGEILQRLEPLARMSDLALLRDVHSGCDGVCCADPEQLRSVLHHLILRALSLEPTPGHVRIMVTLTSREAHILILSRTPAAKLAEHPDSARDDLVAPQRLLQAMGGSLVLEPRRGGYLPLCIALPALAAAAARCAA